jgi:hypothetical protein
LDVDDRSVGRQRDVHCRNSYFILRALVSSADIMAKTAREQTAALKKTLAAMFNNNNNNIILLI